MKKNGHFFEKKSRTISRMDFLKKMMDAGAIDRENMGNYFCPTILELDEISVLPIQNGHVCTICQNSNFYATTSLLTMKWHFRMSHEYVKLDDYISTRKLQTVFNNNRAKYYCIKVSKNICDINFFILNTTM